MVNSLSGLLNFLSLNSGLDLEGKNIKLLVFVSTTSYLMKSFGIPLMVHVEVEFKVLVSFI